MNMLQLFQHVLASIYFLFNGKYYDQLEVAAMGSPLLPAVVDLLLEERQFKPSCFFQFVDDTFVIWPPGTEKLNDFFGVSE